MPSFKIIGLLVLEKKIFKGFYHIWAWRPSWSCDLDHLYKLSFPLPKEAPHKIWLWLAKRIQRRSCLNIVDDDNDDDNGRQSQNIHTDLKGPKVLFVCVEVFTAQSTKRSCRAGVPVYLAPWTACPPGGKLSRDILPPTLVNFTMNTNYIFVLRKSICICS